MDVLYEDNHVIVMYKPRGILSQKDISNKDSMVEYVKKYIKDKYNKPGEVYLGLVHRLDRNTSGLMVFARTSKAASRLSEQVKKHQFNKKYVAVVEGKLEKGIEVTLVNYLHKNEAENKSYVTNNKNDKEAILTYKCLDTKNINGKVLSLVDINLKTGRHHQIRCQMANIGHPLYNDKKYGSGNGEYELYSYHLEFIHPTLKELKSFYFLKQSKMLDYFSSNIIDEYLLK